MSGRTLRSVSGQKRSRDFTDGDAYARHINDAAVASKPKAPKKGKAKGAARGGERRGEEGAEAEAYRRKDKSLGLLCENFMRYCVDSADKDYVISLDQVAKALEIERRRIYDVTNILEALDVVSRKNKNAYVWHGTLHLAHTIKKLRDSALVDAGEADAVIPSQVLTSQPEKAQFFGSLLSQPVGPFVPTCLVSEDLPHNHKRQRTEEASRGQAVEALFGNGLLAYLSAPPHWLYPVHVPHQSAAAAGFSHRGIPTLNPAIRPGMRYSPSDIAELAAPVCRPSWRQKVKELADRAAQGQTWPSAHDGAPMPTLDDCLQPGWLPDECKLECFLEEGNFPEDIRLRSLPLLSELMCLLGDDTLKGKDGMPAEITRIRGGILVETRRHRRDKSLGVLTQRFLKVFLLDKKVMTLDYAAPIVITDEDGDDEAEGESTLVLPLVDEEGKTYHAGAEPACLLDHDSRHNKLKSGKPLVAAAVAPGTDASNKKGRRLYDIANVLVALGLLDRVYVRIDGTRRQAFRWRGPAYVVPLPGAPIPEWAVRKISPPLDARGNAMPTAPWEPDVALSRAAAQVHLTRPVIRPSAAVTRLMTQQYHDNTNDTSMAEDCEYDAAPADGAAAHPCIEMRTVPAPASTRKRKNSVVDASFQYQPVPTPTVKPKYPLSAILDGPATNQFLNSLIIDKTRAVIGPDVFGTVDEKPRKPRTDRHVGFAETPSLDTSFTSTGGFPDMRVPTNLFAQSVFEQIMNGGDQTAAPSPGCVVSPFAGRTGGAIAPSSIAIVRTRPAHRAPAAASEPQAVEGSVSPSAFMQMQSPTAACNGFGSPWRRREAGELLGMTLSIVSQARTQARSVAKAGNRMHIDDLTTDNEAVSRGKTLFSEIDKAARGLAASAMTEGLDASIIAGDVSFHETQRAIWD